MPLKLPQKGIEMLNKAISMDKAFPETVLNPVFRFDK